jgi:hypothetical protein
LALSNRQDKRVPGKERDIIICDEPATRSKRVCRQAD